MTKQEDSVTKGVSNSWDFWLTEHAYSTADRIEFAVKEAFTAWLDQHADQVTAAIAAAVAERWQQ